MFACFLFHFTQWSISDLSDWNHSFRVGHWNRAREPRPSSPAPKIERLVGESMLNTCPFLIATSSLLAFLNSIKNTSIGSYPLQIILEGLIWLKYTIWSIKSSLMSWNPLLCHLTYDIIFLSISLLFIYFYIKLVSCHLTSIRQWVLLCMNVPDMSFLNID